jgi:hypothetical protein
VIAERSTYTFPNTTAEYAGHLSPSQITSYLACPLCYYLGRVRKMPKPLSVNLPIGSAIHKAVETARLSVIEKGGNAFASELVAEDWFDKEIAQPVDPETNEPLDALEIDLGKYESLGQVKDQVVKLAKFVVPQQIALDRKRGKITAVEFNLSMLGVSPYPFAIEGRMDALYCDWLKDIKPEDCELSADLKTSSKQEPPDELTAIAQTVYREHWTFRERKLVIFADVADKRVHPELKSYPLVVDDYAEGMTHQTVLDVADGISAGRFPPHPSWRCDYVHGFAEFQVAVSGFADGE